MDNCRISRALRPMRLLMLSAVSIVGITPAANASFACHEIDAVVTSRGVTIDPPNPKVGDSVSIAFDVEVVVYGSGPSTLRGAEPFLVGDTVVDTGRFPKFELTANARGTATLMLSVSYLTEELCRDETGVMFYRYGLYHRLDFEPFELHISGLEGCTGDCDGNGSITVDEVIWGARVALGQEPVDSCTMLDRNGDGSVAVDDVVAAISAALYGCG